jgi:hypothetical protein
VGTVHRSGDRELERRGAAASIVDSGRSEPRLRLRVPPKPDSAAWIRGELAGELRDADPVVIEQIAVLVGALTSGSDGARAARPFDLELWTRPAAVRVRLRDPDFERHRSEAGLVQLDRSMVTGWRLRMVERLADRWSVAHDGGLTLCFEFDTGDRARGSGGACNGSDDNGSRREGLRPPI